MVPRTFTADYLRNFTFGVEDSLVSTVGLVSGIAVVGMPRSAILLTGTILIFVEAFSMCVGSLLSDNTVREFEQRSPVALTRSLIAALIMFFSYFFSGFVVIAPYVLFDPLHALNVSVVLSLAALFVLGVINASLSGTALLRKGFTMFIIGGGAIVLGIVVGGIMHQW